jgi:hypothetical protein
MITAPVSQISVDVSQKSNCNWIWIRNLFVFHHKWKYCLD